MSHCVCLILTTEQEGELVATKERDLHMTSDLTPTKCAGEATPPDSSPVLLQGPPVPPPALDISAESQVCGMYMYVGVCKHMGVAFDYLATS